MNKHEYIQWYNSLPARVKAVEPWDGKPWRRECPKCHWPMVAKINDEGEVFMDLTHSSQCELWLEWLEYEKSFNEPD
jgi:hypothetical protein